MKKIIVLFVFVVLTGIVGTIIKSQAILGESAATVVLYYGIYKMVVGAGIFVILFKVYREHNFKKAIVFALFTVLTEIGGVVIIKNQTNLSDVASTVVYYYGIYKILVGAGIAFIIDKLK